MPASIDSLSPIDNEGSFSHSSHDVDLQRLDISLPHQHSPTGKLRYEIDNFAGTEEEWDKALAVYIPKGVPIQHVDHAAFARDPQGEARRLGYRIAGHHVNSRVLTGSGEPRLITKAVFTDPEADRFATEGALSVSTGFDMDPSLLSEGRMAGKVRPNHVLYFHRNEKTVFGTPATPNDLGARVNNLSEETMADDETKGTLGKILEAVTQKENPLQKTVDNLTEEMGGKDKEIEALKAEIEKLKAEDETLKAGKAKADNILAEHETKMKNDRWAQVKNLYKPAMFHKAEDEAARRKEFEADPAAFMLANVGNLQTAKPAPAQGKEAIGNLGDDETKPVDVAAIRGTYNPTTHQFEAN